LDFTDRKHDSTERASGVCGCGHGHVQTVLENPETDYSGAREIDEWKNTPHTAKS
jgi:hypothetical protein